MSWFHEHWSLDVWHLNHLGSFLNSQDFEFHSPKSLILQVYVQEPVCLFPGDWCLDRFGNYLVVGRNVDAVSHHICPWTSYFDYLGLCFLIVKLMGLKWWSLRSLLSLHIPLLQWLNQLFSPFVCDSYKVLLFIKEKKRNKISNQHFSCLLTASKMTVLGASWFSDV